MAHGDFNLSVDLVQVQDMVSDMDKSNERMLDGITQLNNIRTKLSDGDIWEGQGARASLTAFEQVLQRILTEQTRLAKLAVTMREYSVELEENERRTANAASNISGLGAGSGQSAGSSIW